jgi:D-sedoheptulose 7-phosphate isomerase
MSTDAIADLLARYPGLAVVEPDVRSALDVLIRCFEGGRKLLVCGNGGSCADADHIVGELVKGFLHPRPLSEPRRAAVARELPEDGAELADALQQGLPAINLAAHASLLTAFGNDVRADYAFAQQVLAYGSEGDVLLGISTSGNARNVALAVGVARGLGLTTIGLTGGTGGRLRGACDVCIVVPRDSTPEIQELHLPLYHALCAGVEARLFGRP